MTIGSFGEFAATDSALAIRAMPSSISLRTSGLYVRSVICSATESGMMLYLVPPWIDPTVSTTGSNGSFSRETSVCQPSTVFAAITIGSTVASGCAPCPLLPKSVTSTESTLASAYPGVTITFPAGASWLSCTATQ